MKFNSWRFYKVVLMTVSSSCLWASELPFKYSGVHYDPASAQYFVNHRPLFNIKPLQSGNFLDRIEYSIDDTAYAPYKDGIKFSQEGLHTLRFKAVDPVNNWSPIQSFRIFVDLSKPASKHNWEGDHYLADGKLFVSPRTKLSISANDNLSGVSRILLKHKDGTIKEYKGPETFEKEGVYELQYLSIDNVGNSEAWQNLSFIVDSSQPSSQVSLKGESFQQKEKLFTRLGSLIELNSTDSSSGIKEIQVKVNSEEVQKYQRPIALDKKFSKIQFRAIDQVGNAEKWQDYHAYVDTDAPDVVVKKVGKHQLLSGKIYATSGFKLDLEMRDSDSGLKSIFINGVEKPIQGARESLTFDQQGISEISVSVVDNVGNKSSAQNFSVVIDNTPPASKIATELALVEREGVLYSSIPNKLSIDSEDSGVGLSTVEISYDGKIFSKLQGPIDLATWKDSQRTIHYRGVDHLGNVESPKSLTIAIRDQGPMVGLFVETEELGNIPLSEVKEKNQRSLAGGKVPAPAAQNRKKE